LREGSGELAFHAGSPRRKGRNFRNPIRIGLSAETSDTIYIFAPDRLFGAQNVVYWDVN